LRDTLWDRAINGDLPRQPLLGQVDPQVDRVEAAFDGSSEEQRSIARPKMHAVVFGSREDRRRDSGDDPSRARWNAPSTGGMDRLE
jgi:hypothetical protein